MKKRAMIGAGLAVAVILILVFSFYTPWYNYNTEGPTEEDEVISIERDFYLNEMEVTENRESETLDYDEEGLNEINSMFRYTEILVMIAVVGSILGLLGAIFVGLDMIKPKIGGTLAIIGIIFALTAPFYMWWSLADAFENDMETDEVGPHRGRSYFMGRGTIGEEERSWGPGIGWFLAIAAGILNMFVSNFTKTAKSKKTKN